MLLLLAIPPAAWAAGIPQWGVAAGAVAGFHGEDSGAVSVKAASEAVVKALDRALVRVVDGEDYIRNHRIIQKNVLSAAADYVSLTRTLETVAGPESVTVTVRVFPDFRNLFQAVNKVGVEPVQPWLPSVCTVVANGDGGVGRAETRAWQMLSSGLFDQGFPITGPYPEDAGSLDAGALREAVSDDAAAARLGAKHDADMVCAMELVSALAMSDRGARANARARLRVVDVKTGSLVVMLEREVETTGDDPAVLLGRAGAGLASALVVPVSREVAAWDEGKPSESSGFRVELLNPGTYLDAVRFEQAVRGLPRVEKFAEISFGRKVLVCRADYFGRRDELAAAIFRTVRDNSEIGGITFVRAVDDRLVFDGGLDGPGAATSGP
ncbi:MAG: hypothetical protein ACLFOY_00620 [Desulfatibacillaceae bacterium]